MPQYFKLLNLLLYFLHCLECPLSNILLENSYSPFKTQLKCSFCDSFFSWFTQATSVWHLFCVSIALKIKLTWPVWLGWLESRLVHWRVWFLVTAHTEVVIDVSLSLSLPLPLSLFLESRRKIKRKFSSLIVLAPLCSKYIIIIVECPLTLKCEPKRVGSACLHLCIRTVPGLWGANRWMTSYMNMNIHRSSEYF